MKKIFTLLFAVGFLMAAHAQPGTRDNSQYDQRDEQQNPEWNKSSPRDLRSDDRYGNINGSYGRASIEMQAARINRKYDMQIQQVRNDFFMRRYEKTRTIRSLELQRQQELRVLYARSKGRDGHREYDSNRRY